MIFVIDLFFLIANSTFDYLPCIAHRLVNIILIQTTIILGATHCDEYKVNQIIQLRMLYVYLKTQSHTCQQTVVSVQMP